MGARWVSLEAVRVRGRATPPEQHERRVSLTRTTKALAAGPQSARDARRWAAQVCLDLGRPDLVGSAELAVSELVTNALLHATPPIRLSVHGNADHPRFEVSDGSVAPPVPRPRGAVEDLDGDLGDHLSTIGRGLAIVAMSSVAWGAYIQPEGKTVWFEPAAGLVEHPRFLGEIHEDGTRGATPDVAPDAVTVRLLDFPVERYAAWLRHFRDLQRELRLLALAHEARYPLARELSGFLGKFADRLRAVGGWGTPGSQVQEDGSVVLDVAPDIGELLHQMTRVLDLADAFCRDERMLTPPTSAPNKELQEWLFGQVISQLDGHAPVPWGSQGTGTR